MDLETLIRLQREFDSKHNWNPPSDDNLAVFRAIQSDLIGIFGEIGEFANIIKKISLEVGHDKNSDLEAILKDRKHDLAEELVDGFIYLVRLASHLNIDVEKSYIEKLALNEQRFKRYEDPRP